MHIKSVSRTLRYNINSLHLDYLVPFYYFLRFFILVSFELDTRISAQEIKCWGPPTPTVMS